MSIAYDVCRCLASSCLQRETCERFVDKAVGGHWVPYSDFSVGVPSHNCGYFIPIVEFAHYESLSQATAQAVEDIKLTKLKLKAKRA